MASEKNNSVNFNKYKRKREMNIGIVIFIIVFIYLVVTVFTYATSKKISVYEVREGSILKDNSYTGLVIREETVISAEKSGYINYFQNEGCKVKANSNIYVITASPLSYEEETPSEDVTLSAENQTTLIVKAQNFNENFSPQKFSDVYTLKTDVQNTLLNASNRTKTVQINSVLAQNSGNAEVYTALQDGILTLNVDGLEDVTTENFGAEEFDRSNYKKTSMEDNLQVAKGDPAYKLITNENWSVLVQLDENTAKELSDTDSVKTRIDKDNETIWADFSILKKDGNYYGKLDYDNSMIRYAGDRYLNVELILEDESGLKIPKSAVAEKDFYAIPLDYLTTGGNSSSSGVIVQKGSSAEFQTVTVYEVTDDDIVYLSPSELKKGTTLVKPESSETLTLTETKPLQGVYNINKGYAVFRQVAILCESDEYYIVQEGDSYGISNYDHIVQDADTVKENEVVTQ